MNNTYTICRNGYRINKDKLSTIECNELRKELTVKPIYKETYNDVIPFSVYLENDNYLYIPKYYGINKYPKYKSKIDKYAKINISFNGELREYQQHAYTKCIEHLDTYQGGLVSVPCGWGKTIFAIRLIAHYNVKTLIIVHKTFLLNQWYERIREFTNARIGCIRQKKINVKNKDIVIGMLQSISMINYDNSIFDDFGMVICDEVHHVAARTFHNALLKTCSHYTIGLSATPNRADGLTKLINWFIGDNMYNVPAKQDNSVKVILFDYYLEHYLYSEKKMYIKGKMKPAIQKMITNMCEISKRNVFITDIIDCVSRLKNRKILILSDRINHLTILKKTMDSRIKIYVKNGILDSKELTTSYYIGSMKSYELNDASDADIIYASYAMASEGLDISTLNTIILSTPKSDIVQAIGRIMRKTSFEIQPLIIDIIDNLSIFPYQFIKREKIYDKRKYNKSMHTIKYIFENKQYDTYIDDNIINRKRLLNCFC
jgi:superfamily II DNA or RNA helicase